MYSFDHRRNTCDPLLDGLLTDFVLGIDLGFVDATAFVVLGFSEDSPDVYVVHSDKVSELTTEDIARKIHALVQRFEPVRIVADSGGLGKMIVEELNKALRTLRLACREVEEARSHSVDQLRFHQRQDLD